MASLTSDEVAARLEARGLAVTAGEATALARFLELLAQWNRVHNLTGIRDPARLVDRHLAESLALEPFVGGGGAGEAADRVADIGSGGGLPGVPLAIRLPDTRFTLIESRRKRASFLRHVAVTLGLGNITVAHGRAESLDLPAFATVVARAVAPPAELIAIARGLVAPGGRLVILTGAARGREIVAAATGFVPQSPGRATGFVPQSPGRAAGGLASEIVVLERELS